MDIKFVMAKAGNKRLIITFGSADATTIPVVARRRRKAQAPFIESPPFNVNELLELI
jgi:hypothetical protein